MTHDVIQYKSATQEVLNIDIKAGYKMLLILLHNIYSRYYRKYYQMYKEYAGFSCYF